LRIPVDADRLKDGIVEVRCYDAPAWHGAPPPQVASAFRRAGIYPIVSAAVAASEHMPRFTYVIPFESLAARQDAWARLDFDPEWIEMQREHAKRGSLVKVTAKSIYKLAPLA